MSDAAKVDAALNRAMDCDRRIEAALREKYPPEVARWVVPNSPSVRWNLTELVKSYRESSVFPLERLPSFVDDLIDMKLQLYFLSEVDLGLYNTLYHNKINEHPSLSESERLRLIHLSLDQGIIVKARILWERIMNAIYYLETGQVLDDQVSRKKGKSAHFFELVASVPRWRWLEPYKAELDSHADSFRTPEVHKKSTLRRIWLDGALPDPDRLVRPINRAMNTIWENLVSVIGGSGPTHFSDLHLDSDGNIDARYQPEA